MTITSHGSKNLESEYFVGVEQGGKRYQVWIDGSNNIRGRLYIAPAPKRTSTWRTLKSLPISVTREARHTVLMTLFGRSPYAGFFEAHPSRLPFFVAQVER